MAVQRKWMYLESIFIGSDDIRLQLPQEATRFDNINKAWLKIMSETSKNTNVLDACSADGRWGPPVDFPERLGSRLHSGLHCRCCCKDHASAKLT
jgi:hypothetical protein